MRTALTIGVLILLSGCATGGAAMNGEASMSSRALSMLNPKSEVSGARNWPQDASVDMVAIKATVKAALTAYQEQRFEEAQAHYQRAEQLGASDETILFWLGNYALISADLASAQRYYEAVLRTNPANAKALYNLGVVYLSRAEDHFHFYAATVPDQEVEQKLVTLLSSIDQFSDGNASSQTSSPLDSLRELLEN